MDFVQCSYVGQSSADGRRFDGLGRFTFANGDVYLGGMQDGHFHGQGVVFFRESRGPASTDAAPPGADADLQAFLNPTAPTAASAVLPSDERWSGQYRGVWEQGRHVAGHYVFQDGLVYGNDAAGQAEMTAAAWAYCHGGDRRLWAEYLENVAPVLPHEALLGGAKVLHARKTAMKSEATSGSTASSSGEGLPMVLPRAFVQARAAPAFATGQLASIHDARVTRWTAAAATAVGAAPAPSPEMVEATVALQLALSRTTQGLQVHGGEGAAAAPTAAEPAESLGDGEGGRGEGGASQAKLNLSVCRVRDVEDVNRALVQVVPAP